MIPYAAPERKVEARPQARSYLPGGRFLGRQIGIEENPTQPFKHAQTEP